MDPQLLDIIVKVVASVAISLVTTFLIPAITSWISNSKNKKLKAFIDNAVDAAEQIYGPGTAKIKKAYVLDMIKSKFRGINIADSTIDMLVEASVSRVSAAIKQAKEVAAVQGSGTAQPNYNTATTTQNGLIVAKQESKTYKSAGDSNIKLS